MLQQIGATIAKAAGKRTHAPVRRNSRHAGKCEAVFWQRTDRQTVRQIVLAARRYEIGMKAPGARNGPLGNVALEVLEYLANVVEYRTGRLEPSIDTLMEKLRRSRDAVVRALKALRDHGFVDWLRRYIPTNNGGAGPQVQQTSNAYRLALPARAKAFLGKYGVGSPPPEDAAQVLQERQEAIAEHKASLTPAERVRESVEDTEQAERWAGYLERRKQAAAEGKPAELPAQAHLFSFAAVAPTRRSASILEKIRFKRESAKQTESGPEFLSKKEE
ncbi:Probable replicating protein RepA [Neorhizobium galegae bv. officinalis]|nr:Probable replicating protein RepA [Neorhizobium galegae bv. officinalis]